MTEAAIISASENALSSWQPGNVPIAIVMISLNEAHNMADVLENLKGFAQEVFLVDSYSSDETVNLALTYGVHVVQRKFHGFGDQWNFAMQELPVTAPWTFKLDPDERLSDELKQSIREVLASGNADGLMVRRRLWFMGRSLPVIQTILRGWRTGTCRFSDVVVNEYPLVEGRIVHTNGDLEHHDSPDLHHWYDKQNRYSSAEAMRAYHDQPFAVMPKLFGNSLERRMWMKSKLTHMPFRSLLIFFYCYIWQGAWKAGRVGFIWSRLRVDVYRMGALKLLEMRWNGKPLRVPSAGIGQPHPAAMQAVSDYDKQHL